MIHLSRIFAHLSTTRVLHKPSRLRVHQSWDVNLHRNNQTQHDHMTFIPMFLRVCVCVCVFVGAEGWGEIIWISQYSHEFNTGWLCARLQNPSVISSH